MSAENEYPKWVVPHETHIQRIEPIYDGAPHVSVAEFKDFHAGRDGVVTVLASDDAEERRALAPSVASQRAELQAQAAQAAQEREEREAAERAVVEKEAAENAAREAAIADAGGN